MLNFMEIYWRFILDTPHPKKVEEITKKLLRVMGETVTIEQKNIYWKDRSKTEILVREIIQNTILQDELILLFHKISKIYNHWNIDFPNDIDKNLCDLLGVCNKGIKVRNVSWASFMINQ